MCSTLSSTNRIGAKECAAQHGMVLELSSAAPIGANTMFFQIGRRYTPFSGLHQFFSTLPIIWAQVAAKLFFC
jgi:hypothetical protein